jgi:hypothetical protein
MLKEIKVLEIISIVIGIITVTILYKQFQAQKKLWDIQAELHSVDLQIKKGQV